MRGYYPDIASKISNAELNCQRPSLDLRGHFVTQIKGLVLNFKSRVSAVIFVLLLCIVGSFGYGIYKVYYSHPGRFSSEVTTEGLTREVVGNTLISRAHPAAQITIPDEYMYLGAQRFVLFGTVQAEQYMFASAHPDGSTKALINLQFETILPDIKGHYDYSSAPRKRRIGLLDFDVDADPALRHWLVRNGLPGTDGEKFNSFVEAKGFPIPKHYIWTRFAYVPKDAPRNEMLILQSEDLSPFDRTAPSLRSGGALEDDWNGLIEAHIDRLQQQVLITLLE